MSFIKGYAVGFVLGAAIWGTCGYFVGKAPEKETIPQVEQVQQGYVAPSKLEIQCQDLDGNGEPETIMRIGDKPYLLREVNGKPVISAYEIRPAEVVPKSE